MVFLLLSPLWVCRIGKNHTLSQNNEKTTNYKDLLKNTTQQLFTDDPFTASDMKQVMRCTKYDTASPNLAFLLSV